MRMIIFPYGHDFEPVIRHAGLLDTRYEIVALVSPGGWGLSGKEIVMRNTGRMLHIYERIQDVTEEYDSLFIPSIETPDEEVENRLVDEMVKMISHLSHIVCAARLTDTNRKKLQNACRLTKSLCDFEDFSEHKEPKAYGLTEAVEQFPSLQTLDIPVVMVAGVWEKTDKFEVSLALREQFLKEGYRLSQVGSRNGCEMLGFHSFPGFMFRKDVDAIDKIIYFNQWIVQIAEKEQPDMMMITIPGAMQNYNEQLTRGFGMLHHQVFQAVTPDILVMCTFYMSVEKDILEELSRLCEYKFGIPVDAFHMSNLFIDRNESEEQRQIVTNSIYRKFVSETIMERCLDCSVPIFNMLETGECERMADMILGKLTPKDVQVIF